MLLAILRLEFPAALPRVFNLDYYIMPKPGKLLLFGIDKFSTDAGPL
jgi:hypothetical protein